MRNGLDILLEKACISYDFKQWQSYDTWQLLEIIMIQMFFSHSEKHFFEKMKRRFLMFQIVSIINEIE